MCLENLCQIHKGGRKEVRWEEERIEERKQGRKEKEKQDRLNKRREDTRTKWRKDIVKVEGKERTT